MNLNFVVIGLVLMFGIGFGIQYGTNLKKADRYQQLFLPFIAFLLFLLLLQLDVTMIRFYHQFFEGKLTFLSPYVKLLYSLTLVASFLAVKLLWRMAHHFHFKRIASKFRLLKSISAMVEKGAKVIYPKDKIEAWKSRLAEYKLDLSE